MSSVFDQLPAVNDVLAAPAIIKMGDQFGHAFVKQIIRNTIDYERRGLIDKSITETSLVKVIDGSLRAIEVAARPSLRSVINASGVILHTNLGRSVLSPVIRNEIEDVAFNYSTLEYDLRQRSRGSRYGHVTDLLKELTGAEDALVVNNNAAAVMLVLDTLARDSEVITSRGELVEIGGSFRVPEIITSVNGRLHEVGTTNKTHLSDYEHAINEQTGAILKVHTSNYKIIGFTQSVDESELIALAHQHHLPLITDLGSGLMVYLQQFGITDEPTVAATLQFSDLVAFSGDKLLGGPQAGIIVGKKEYIDQIKKNQLLRALRVDKLTLAALEATLRIYRRGDQEAVKEIPVLKMLTIDHGELQQRAGQLRKLLEQIDGLTVAIVAGSSEVGGGTFPGLELPTVLVEIETPQISTTQLEQQLRGGIRPVIARIQNDHLQFDIRTLITGDIEAIAKKLRVILND